MEAEETGEAGDAGDAKAKGLIREESLVTDTMKRVGNRRGSTARFVLITGLHIYTCTRAWPVRFRNESCGRERCERQAWAQRCAACAQSAERACMRALDAVSPGRWRGSHARIPAGAESRCGWSVAVQHNRQSER